MRKEQMGEKVKKKPTKKRIGDHQKKKNVGAQTDKINPAYFCLFLHLKQHIKCKNKNERNKNYQK